MKQLILNILRISLFLLVAISVITPQVGSIEFCTVTEQVMLQFCHCDQDIEANDNEVSEADADCCDEITLSDVKIDSQFEKIQLKALFRSVWFTMPTTTWILVKNIEETPIVEARGPPLVKIPLFIQNCSYLI